MRTNNYKGLEHEHQRHDAGSFIRIESQNIGYIELLDSQVAEFNELVKAEVSRVARYNMKTITRDQVMSDYSIAAVLEAVLGYGWPGFNALLPYQRSDNVIEIIDQQEVGISPQITAPRACHNNLQVHLIGNLSCCTIVGDFPKTVRTLANQPWLRSQMVQHGR